MVLHCLMGLGVQAWHVMVLQQGCSSRLLWMVTCGDHVGDMASGCVSLTTRQKHTKACYEQGSPIGY